MAQSTLDLVFADPAYSMMAQRVGMSPQAYWDTLDVAARNQHLYRVVDGPAVYSNPSHIDTFNRVGANSGANAAISSGPAYGYDGSPVQPMSPDMGGGSGMLSSSPDVNGMGRESPLLTQQGIGLPPNVGDAGAPTPDLAYGPQNGRGSVRPEQQPVVNASNGVLASGGVAATQGALSNGGTGAPSSAPASSGGTRPTANTGNARGSNIPDLSVGRGAAFARMGGAILSNAGNGLANALGAGATEMGNIDDENRAAQLKQFEIEEARRVEAQRLAAARARSSGGGSGSGGTPSEAMATINQIDDMLAMLEQGGMTGPIDGTIQAWLDRSGLRDFYYGNDEGARRAYIRNQLEAFKVDEALAYTANTKGAISDREMALFLAPIPRQTDDEQVWINTLLEKRRIAEKIAASDGRSVPTRQPSGAAPQPDTSGYTIEEITE